MGKTRSMPIDGSGVSSDFLPMYDLHHDNSQTDTCKILMDSDMVS